MANAHIQCCEWRAACIRNLEKLVTLLFLVKDKAVSVEANKQPKKKKNSQGEIPGLSEGLQLKVIELSSLRH